MVDKVVILSLKPDYALAMKEGGEILRIRRKPGMAVGDEVYLLPEDLYGAAAAPGGTVPPHRRRALPQHARRWTALAAMLALVIALVVPQLSMDAYAVVSIDAQQSVQLTVDEANRVLTAESPDGTLPIAVLRQLRGRSLSELIPQLHTLLGSGPFLIAYAPTEPTASIPTEAQLRSLFGDASAVYFSCEEQDLRQAQAQDQTLPRYMLSLLLDEDALDLLDDYYEQQDPPDTPDTPDEEGAEQRYASIGLPALLDALKQNPALLQSEAFRSVFFDRLEEEQDRIEDAREDADEDDAPDAPDEDEDEDDDEEDVPDEDDADDLDD